MGLANLDTAEGLWEYTRTLALCHELDARRAEIVDDRYPNGLLGLPPEVRLEVRMLAALRADIAIVEAGLAR